jgi:uncharacterized protein (DUF1330 family)
MAAYLIACVEWHSSDAIETYGAITRESLRLHGGRYLVRGSPYAHVDGEHPPKRLAVVEFPTAAAAMEWSRSDAYAPAVKIRAKHATTHWIVIMEGMS